MFRALMLAVVAISLMPTIISAQQMPTIPQLPVDPAVRVGKLDNGLTYYIRHNELPKGQADFYIAQKVGSILEEDNQRGLAHFLEHMCFNGTTHFPGNSLIDWLESVGVKFGANLNAYTSIDETVYNISSVPTARESVQDSCLLILHDWANDLTLDPEEIDKERGVIHQEWRRSNNGQSRILTDLLPVIYPNNKYGYRMPIGTMEVVDNFPPQALRDYYEKWYRPDQQAVIVVGDIDVDRIENKIKEIFSDIPAQPDAAPREYLPVEDTPGTIYAIGHDKEMPQSVAFLMFKSDPMPDEMKNTQMYYMQQWMEYAIAYMLNQRLNDIASKPNAPFAHGRVDFGDFLVSRTKDALELVTLTTSSDSLPSGLAAVYREVLRAARGGFTQSEFERAQNEYISRSEKQYENRENVQSGNYSREYASSFTKNEPIPGIEVEHQLISALVKQIPLQVINQVFSQSVTPDNRVLLAMMPDNEAGVYPTEEQFAAALAAVDAEDIEPYAEELKSEPLIENLPAPGKIISTEENTQWGATVWTLSNGAKVWFKHTEFNLSEVLFSAISDGTGFTQFPDSDAPSILFMQQICNDNSLGTYTSSDLKKYLSGKQVSLSIGPSTYGVDLSGKSTPKDIKYLMELIYMTFTGYGLDSDEFTANQQSFSSILKTQETTPNFVFSKYVQQLVPSPKSQMITSSDVEKADRNTIVNMVKKMLDNAANYTFAFVGNIDAETLRPLVEQYIATIPGNAATSVHKIDASDKSLLYKGGKATDTYSMKMETPQTLALFLVWGNEDYTPANQKIASIAGQILSKRLLNIVREDMGAVYSIGAGGVLYRVNPQNALIQSSFPMKPEMKEEVIKVITEQLNDMTTNVKEEELAPVKEYMIKSAIEAKELNNSWLGGILGWNRLNVDTFNDAESVINSITTQDVQNYVKDLINQGNMRWVILDPEM